MMKNYNLSLTGLIVSVGEIYHGDLVEGDKLMSSDEVIAYKEGQFKKDFFETSIGWIRKDVHLQNGKQKDFLFDCVPLLKTTLVGGCLPANSFLYYDEPDYAQESDRDYVLGAPRLNEALSVEQTTVFFNECALQTKVEFWG